MAARNRQIADHPLTTGFIEPLMLQAASDVVDVADNDRETHCVGLHIDLTTGGYSTGGDLKCDIAVARSVSPPARGG
ncbi:MAG: hypothetical protein HKL85_10905 [Acidimicrobiaceae bacterium]|nr:hypothetical protein [Acidimicrobiaceae bacterium]